MSYIRINYNDATKIEKELLKETIKKLVKEETPFFNEMFVTPKPKIKGFEIYRQIKSYNDFINRLQFNIHFETRSYEIIFTNYHARNFEIFNKILNNSNDQDLIKFKVKLLLSSTMLKHSKFSDKPKICIIADFKHYELDLQDEYLKSLGLNWFSRKIMKLVYFLKHK